MMIYLDRWSPNLNHMAAISINDKVELVNTENGLFTFSKSLKPSITCNYLNSFIQHLM